MHKKAAVSQKVRTAAFILVTKIHSRPFQRRLFCDTRFAAVANVLKIRESQLQHDAVLEDGDLAEAVLLGLGLLTAGNADDQVQQVLCGLVDGLLAVSDDAGVEVDPADFFSASGVLVEIFRVGAGAENGVPRPVEKRMRCAPAAVMAVADTRSLPGP